MSKFLDVLRILGAVFSSKMSGDVNAHARWILILLLMSLGLGFYLQIGEF